MQTPAQEKTERLSVHPCDSRRRESSEKCRCKRSVLGPEQSSAGVVQSWPHLPIHELLLQLLGRLLLPFERWLVRFWVFISGWRRIRQFNPRRHLETSGSQRPLTLTYCLETWHRAICQTCDNEFSDEWVALSDHTEGIGPTGPMCGDTDSTGTETPWLRARGWRTRGRLKELFASRGSGKNKTKHCHRGGQQILAFVLVALISTRNKLLWMHTSKRRRYAACVSFIHGILWKRDCCSRDLLSKKVNDESRLPDGNSQNLQPLLMNWKQRVTSPHHSVWLPLLQPWSVLQSHLVPAPLCSTLASSRDATGCARGTRALHQQPHVRP